MTTIKAAVDDLLNNHQLSTQDAVDRHFGPTFRQRVNGSSDDRAGFLARIAGIRDVVEHATAIVLDELSDGNRYAERHIIDAVHRDGTRSRQEVFVFAERDSDGRFARIEETSRTLTHDEADPPR